MSEKVKWIMIGTVAVVAIAAAAVGGFFCGRSQGSQKEEKVEEAVKEDSAVKDAAKWTSSKADSAAKWTGDKAKDAADWTGKTAEKAANWTGKTAEKAANWTENLFKKKK